MDLVIIDGRPYLVCGLKFDHPTLEAGTPLVNFMQQPSLTALDISTYSL